MAFVRIEKDSLIKDTLTKLNTRGQLEQKVKYYLKTGASFGLIMMDLNDFKSINDVYGHDEGDVALKTVASIISVSVKRHDMVCRYGGDEFMVLLESCAEGAGEKAKARIEEGLNSYNNKNIKPYDISMSYGVICIEEEKLFQFQDLMVIVDRKMYKDKSIRKMKGNWRNNI